MPYSFCLDSRKTTSFPHIHPRKNSRIYRSDIPHPFPWQKRPKERERERERRLRLRSEIPRGARPPHTRTFLVRALVVYASIGLTYSFGDSALSKQPIHIRIRSRVCMYWRSKETIFPVRTRCTYRGRKYVQTYSTYGRCF